MVAASVDTATERIVEYLTTYDVPVNVVSFRYFEDDGRRYLARTWLIDEKAAQGTAGGTRGTRKEPWNERDWYVSFGEESLHRSWDDARRFGFVSAGGGPWFSRTLLNLTAGSRVFVCIPKLGYVGVGVVSGAAQAFDDAVVSVDGARRKLANESLTGSYVHDPAHDGSDVREFVVPVSWIKTVPREEAVWKAGMFANQNTACKLRNAFTLKSLREAFDLDE